MCQESVELRAQQHESAAPHPGGAQGGGGSRHQSKSQGCKTRVFLTNHPDFFLGFWGGYLDFFRVFFLSILLI